MQQRDRERETPATARVTECQVLMILLWLVAYADHGRLVEVNMLLFSYLNVYIALSSGILSMGLKRSGDPRLRTPR